MAFRAALAIALVAAAPAAALPNCRAGHTLYAEHGVRIFDLSHPEHDPGFAPTFYHRIFGCRRAVVWRIYVSSPYNHFRVYHLQRSGRRVGFLTHDAGWDNGFFTEAGWTDVATHETRAGLINAGEDGAAGDPYVPDDVVSYAIAADGAMAVLGGRQRYAQQVALLVPRPGTRRSFRRARILADAAHGGIVQGSLAIGAKTVRWRTAAGRLVAVPRA